MRLVVLASPYSGNVDSNGAYARKCLQDSLLRGEAPFASHLLYPQVLNDSVPADRQLGSTAGLVWIQVADALVVYADHGVSKGMGEEIKFAERISCTVEIRYIEKESS